MSPTKLDPIELRNHRLCAHALDQLDQVLVPDLVRVFYTADSADWLMLVTAAAVS